MTPAQQAQQVKNSIVIAQLLNGKSTTFAQIKYTTEVKTSAANKARKVLKHTDANVQLFSNIKAATSVFSNAVRKQSNVAEFTAQSTYYEHTACYSIVQHKTQPKLYLYAIFNNSKSEYTIDGVPATKEDVAELLTPAAARDLLAPSKPVYNATYDIEHNVIVRTVGLHNITEIKAAGQTVTL